jgi:ATP-dependent DNA helicase RecG
VFSEWASQSRLIDGVEESEVLQCEAAEKTAVLLTETLADVRIGLVHGRMKAADKDQVMQAFKEHKLDLLDWRF